MSDALDEMIDEVLRPLLEADGGSISLVEAGDGVVRVKLSGNAAFGAGATFVQRWVITPAIQAALGPEVQVRFDKKVALPRRRRAKG